MPLAGGDCAVLCCRSIANTPRYCAREVPPLSAAGKFANRGTERSIMVVAIKGGEMKSRSWYVFVVLVAGALLWSEVASAQSFPARPVRLLVPFAPGGGAATLARVLGQKMSESMGQQIIVDNRPGGNTLVAGEHHGGGG